MICLARDERLTISGARSRGRRRRTFGRHEGSVSMGYKSAIADEIRSARST